MKKYQQVVLMLIIPCISFTLLESQIQLGSSQIGEDGNFAGISVDISANGQSMVYGAMGANEWTGNARVMAWDGIEWQQKGEILEGFAEGSLFGYAVAMSSSGNIIAVGAPEYDNKRGQVYVYEWDGTNWIQKGSSIDGVEELDECGFSVAVSSDGNILAVGAKFHNEYTGHVRIYKWIDNEWSQLGTDIEALESGDYEGYSVALSSDGNRIVTGAERHDGFRGRIRIFDWNGTEWVQVGETIEGTESGDNSGWSVALSSDGNIVATGAVVHDNFKGQVRIFEWDGMNWNQLGDDIVGLSVNSDAGWSVDLSADGHTVAVGAPFYDANKGYVSLLDWDGTEWVLSGMNIEGDNNGDFAGSSCALSDNGKTVIIGMFRHSQPNEVSNGQVKVYGDNTVKVVQSDEIILEVFPNPSVESIRIEGADINRIEIVDAQGRICQVEEESNSMVDVSILPKGVYFIRVLIDGKIISKKLIKE